MKTVLQIVLTPVLFGGFLDALTGGWLFRKLNIGYARTPREKEEKHG